MSSFFIKMSAKNSKVRDLSFIIGLFLFLSVVPFLHNLNLILSQLHLHSIYGDVNIFGQFSTWAHSNFGNNSSPSLWQFPSIELFFNIFSWLGLTLAFTTHFFPIILLFAGFLSAYLLFKYILSKYGSPSYWIPVLPTIFYIYNLYTLDLISGNYVLLIPHFLLPLQLFFFFKCIETEKKYLPLFVLLSCFVFGVNLVYDVILFFLMIVLYPLLYEVNKTSVIKHLKYFSLFVGLSLLANLWWLAPMFYSSLTNIQNSSYVLQSETFYNNDTGPLNVLRNLGSWGFFGSSSGIPYKSFAHFYKDYLLYVSFFITLVIFAFPLFLKKINLSYEKKKILFAYTLLLLLFAFIGGTYQDWPTAGMMQMFFAKIPFAEIFRNTYKWTSPVILITSLLLFYICIFIYQKSKKWFYFFATILTFFILLNVAPLLSGSFIDQKNIVTKVPQYWYDMSNYINKNIDPISHRALLLPDQYFTVFNWDNSLKILSGNIADSLIKVPSVYNTCTGCGISYSLQVDSYLFKNLNTGKLDNLMQLFGITNILQRNDFFIGYYKQSQNPAQIKKILSRYPDIYLDKTIGQLDLYTLQQASSSPVIYSPDDIFSIDTLNELIPSLPFHDLTPQDSFITLDDVQNKDVLWDSIYVKDLLDQSELASTTVNGVTISKPITIPIQGKYNIFQAESDNFTQWASSFMVKNASFEATISSFTGVFLTPGTYTLSKNIILDQVPVFYDSFDAALTKWSSVINCSATKGDTILGLSLPVVEGIGKVLQLSANQDMGCTRYSNISVLPNTYYILSFDHSVLQGTQYGFCIWNGSACLSKEILGNSTDVSGWQKGQFLFKTAGNKNIQIYLYAPAQQTASTVQFDNVSVRKVLNLSGEYAIKGIPDNKIESATVSNIEQINNSLYRVHIKTNGPFHLIFQESFHPKWKLLVTQNNGKQTLLDDLGFGNGKPLDPSNHYVANGYANGWYVDASALCMDNSACTKNADGSYDIEMVIEFWPQRWFYLGLLISGTTLLGCLGYLGYEGVKRIRIKLKK